MKGTDNFKQTIQAHLEQLATADPLFAERYADPAKNLDHCVTYVLNWVKNQGCQGFADDEIFGQVVHYYQETDIAVGNPINCRVVVNHAVELTDEDIAQARKEALQKAQNEEYARLKQSATPKVKLIDTSATQTSLF